MPVFASLGQLLFNAKKQHCARLPGAQPSACMRRPHAFSHCRMRFVTIYIASFDMNTINTLITKCIESVQRPLAVRCWSGWPSAGY